MWQSVSHIIHWKWKMFFFFSFTAAGWFSEVETLKRVNYCIDYSSSSGVIKLLHSPDRSSEGCLKGGLKQLFDYFTLRRRLSFKIMWKLQWFISTFVNKWYYFVLIKQGKHILGISAAGLWQRSPLRRSPRGQANGSTGAQAFLNNKQLITGTRLHIHAVWWVSAGYSVVFPQHHSAARVYLQEVMRPEPGSWSQLHLCVWKLSFVWSAWRLIFPWSSSEWIHPQQICLVVFLLQNTVHLQTA